MTWGYELWFLLLLGCSLTSTLPGVNSTYHSKMDTLCFFSSVGISIINYWCFHLNSCPNLEWRATGDWGLLILNVLYCVMNSGSLWSHLSFGDTSKSFVSLVFPPLPSMAAEARGKRCHNFNTCPCWIHKIITHTCHLFVMILSLLTYLHIKALIKISKERNAYFKINSEGNPCTASRVVLFLFAVVFCLSVCCLHD